MGDRHTATSRIAHAPGRLKQMSKKSRRGWALEGPTLEGRGWAMKGRGWAMKGRSWA